VAHGEANYVLLTSVLKKYATKQCITNYNDTINVLAAALDCTDSQVSIELDNLLSVILNKQPMSAYGTTEDDIEVFADSVLKYQQVIMSHNPTVLSKEDIIDIYNDCL
jgi:4-hydroxybutyrate dehydrogenase